MKAPKKGERLRGTWENSRNQLIQIDMLINLIVFCVLGIIDLTFELRIFARNSIHGPHGWNHLRFAVVDLDRSKTYPDNFVSMLPMRINSDGKPPSVFTKFFGNKSLKIAIELLTKSLKKEQTSEIKAEIERRLKLLEPDPFIHIKCHVCRQFFKTTKEKVQNQKICPECIKRFNKK
jgi:hypothetical protein